MSRIGKQPIPIPDGVEVNLSAEAIRVKGKLGELTQEMKAGIQVEVQDKQVLVTRENDERSVRALHGLMRSLIANMITGVSEGYKIVLDMVGVGYKAQASGNKLTVNAGYSHPVDVIAPEGVQFQVDGDTAITVSGYDKQKVGQVASDIRRIRKPEPYKGKGIKYRTETIRRKAGKTGKA